jgi:hypothetical protein
VRAISTGGLTGPEPSAADTVGFVRTHTIVI